MLKLKINDKPINQVLKTFLDSQSQKVIYLGSCQNIGEAFRGNSYRL